MKTLGSIFWEGQAITFASDYCFKIYIGTTRSGMVSSPRSRGLFFIYIQA